MIRYRKNTTSRLRHKLTLQQEVQTADTMGGYTRTWKNVADIWAEILPVKGTEALAAGKLETELSHKILVRYRADITSGHRFYFEGRIFNIHHVSNVQENDEILQLLVEEGAAG